MHLTRKKLVGIILLPFTCFAKFYLTCILFLTEQALKKHLSRLPEPPKIRDNLKKEIKMFVEMLQQSAKEEGRYEFYKL